MKKSLILIAVLFSIFAFQVPQQPKVFNFQLTEAEVIDVYNAIDNASLSGERRKPLLQKIQDQYTAQLKPDTTHKKK